MSWEPKACRVSFTDRQGLEHSVQVVARSRNEAAVRALAEFRRMNRDDTGSLSGPYQTDKLLVRIVQEQSHEVSVREAELWLERHGLACGLGVEQVALPVALSYS